MSLVWHIVRKDFRRLSGPLMLWLLLVLGHLSLLFIWDGEMGTDSSALEGKRYFVNACGVVVRGVGFILAAWLVMEDSLVSTQAFWRTRALSGGRLMAAKVLGAILMFSVLPVVVLAPIWLWCGFSARELAWAAYEFGCAQALCSLAAFALGSVTETSGQFLVRLIGGAIVLPLFVAFALRGFPSNASVSDGLDVTRTMIVIGLLGLTPMTMTAHQFLARRVGRTWFLFAVATVLMLLVGRWWPWDIAGSIQSPPTASPSANSDLIFSANRLGIGHLNSIGNRLPMQMEGRVTGFEPGMHVRVDRVQGWWTDETGFRPGPRFVGVAINGLPDPAVLRRAAGLQASIPKEVTWTATGGETWQVLKEHGAPLLGRGDRTKEPGSAQVRLGGVVQATMLRATVLGELPLAAGATLRAGSSLTRIKSLKWVDDNLVVLIEERDAWTPADGAYASSYNPNRRRIRPREDGFVVLSRAHGFEQLPVVQDIGTLAADSIVVGRRNLVIKPSEPGADWLDDAVIVKVRFVPVQKITQSLAGEPLAMGR